MLPSYLVETISVVSDAFVALSALAVAIIGFIGLRQWREELTGKAKFEVARKIVTLSFQFRDEFGRARSPLTFGGEAAERPKFGGETEEETQLLDECFARKKRLEPLQESMRKLREASWEAEIVLSEDVGKLLQPFEHAFIELWSAIEAYFSTQLKRAKSGQRNSQLDDGLKSQQAIIYGIDDKPSRAVDASVTALLRKLKAYVK